MTIEYSENTPSIEEVKALSGDTIIEFSAPWCSHCQRAEPFISEALKAHPSVRYIKIYDGKGKRLGRLFKVKLWPTVIRLSDGQEVCRVVRPVSLEDADILFQAQ